MSTITLLVAVLLGLAFILADLAELAPWFPRTTAEGPRTGHEVCDRLLGQTT
ncbi:hypothetical protein AB0D74_03140 [Streptomyces sp. NPDC048278]|uniref:hypothetical protein n=1 Tax=unclassified Streptomyces TaxID=2593676 RepID=UPI003446F226